MANSQSYEISEEQWLSEVTELAGRSHEQPLFVLVRISYVHLFSRVSRLEVHDRTLLLHLWRLLPGGSSEGALTFYLPEQTDQTEYWKETSDSGETILTATNPLDITNSELGHCH